MVLGPGYQASPKRPTGVQIILTLSPSPGPHQNDAPFFLHLAKAKISKTLLFVCDGNAPAAALRDAATRGGASAALAAALDDALAAAAPTPRAGARLLSQHCNGVMCLNMLFIIFNEYLNIQNDNVIFMQSSH